MQLDQKEAQKEARPKHDSCQAFIPRLLLSTWRLPWLVATATSYSHGNCHPTCQLPPTFPGKETVPHYPRYTIYHVRNINSYYEEK
jgi:hypothetical protein